MRPSWGPVVEAAGCAGLPRARPVDCRDAAVATPGPCGVSPTGRPAGVARHPPFGRPGCQTPAFRPAAQAIRYAPIGCLNVRRNSPNLQPANEMRVSRSPRPPGSRVASWRSLSWISRSRSPGRTVGRCTGRSLGYGGSRPPGSPGSPSKLRRSVGSWRVGIDPRISSWRWTIGPSWASPGSRPPGSWMSWSGPGWSLSIRRQAGLRLLQSWKLP
jgi:hypothetical protein